MEALDFKELTPTKDYLQDIAKVVGKVQQLFVPVHPSDWHKGLKVTENGLETQPLTKDGVKVIMDLKRGDISNGQTAWKLGDYTAEEMLDELGRWAHAEGAASLPEKPELENTDPADYDAIQAGHILEAAAWSTQQLISLEPILLTGVTSPVLLYPHHFDLSLVWFPLRNEETDTQETRQVGFGFSFGDEHIKDAYFYVTAWPEQESFKDTPLPSPAYWQKSGFSGAVIKLNDILRTDSPEQTLKSFLEATAEGGRDAFGA